MADNKLVGAIFSYFEGGFDYNVSFECAEVIEPTLGIKMAEVSRILVTDMANVSSNDLVDMEKVEKICNEKATEAIMTKLPPDLDNLN